MIPEKVRVVLDRFGLKALEFEPGSTPTAEAAARRIGVQTGQIAKSLLFKGKSGRVVMVVCAGDARISSKKMKELCGEKMSMTDPDETYALTGFWPGGVCPFGVDGIEIFIDESLRKWERIFPAAGTDATGVPMTVETLVAATGGTFCSVCGE